jgi:hypothetical protein
MGGISSVSFLDTFVSSLIRYIGLLTTRHNLWVCGVVTLASKNLLSAVYVYQCYP